MIAVVGDGRKAVIVGVRRFLVTHENQKTREKFWFYLTKHSDENIVDEHGSALC